MRRHHLQLNQVIIVMLLVSCQFCQQSCVTVWAPPLHNVILYQRISWCRPAAGELYGRYEMIHANNKYTIHNDSST